LHVEDGGNFILNGATRIPKYTASYVKSIRLIAMRQPKILHNILYSLFMYGFLVGENEERKPHGRPRVRWEANIKLDIQEVVGRLGLSQHREKCEGCCECGNERSGSTKCEEFLDELWTC
jgi:hypothetical protein